MMTEEVFYVACAITNHYTVKGNNYFLMLACRNWLHGRAQQAEDMGCLSVQLCMSHYITLFRLPIPQKYCCYWFVWLRTFSLQLRSLSSHHRSVPSHPGCWGYIFRAPGAVFYPHCSCVFVLMLLFLQLCTCGGFSWAVIATNKRISLFLPSSFGYIF